jgi:pilus assembly protein CpaE
LLDLALTFGHCALGLNLTPRRSLADLSDADLQHLDSEMVRPCLETHGSTLRVLTGALRPEDGEAVTGDHVRAALGLLRRTLDVVVVDTGSVFTDATIAALEMADQVVLVCTPEMSTLRDVRECQRIFTDLIHVPRDKVSYVMNNPRQFKPLPVDQFAQALEQDLHFEIPFGNDVPSKAATNGEAFTQTQSASAVAKAIDRLARALEGGEASLSTPQPERRGFFGLR